ncbi:hypothetical protein [Mucilaginibacter sp.]|uniref:hypothetical protein n=1 Tax=Mucilaginibacter sp. TaxID=1882438 RepID=UPI003266B7B0
MEKPKSQMKIVGINLLVMVVYTILCRVGYKTDGFIIVACLIVGHIICCFIACVVSAFIAQYRHLAGIWLLSALAVLLIGFSTCMAAFTIKI